MFGSDDSWALQNAQGARIFWCKDSTRFVLDEAIYYLSGNATLGTILENANGIEGADHITTLRFEPLNLGLSGINQWRIRVDKGWISPNSISMEIDGTSNSNGEHPNGEFAQKFVCEVDDATHFRFVKENDR